MEDTATFSAGMNRQHHPVSQPPGSYRSARNMVRRGDGSLELERGTSPQGLLPSGMDPVGSLVLGEETVYFLCGGGASEIGIHAGSAYRTVFRHPALAFRPDHPVDAEGRKDYRGHRLVYFCDGRNSLRRIDLDAPPDAGASERSVSEALELFLSHTYPFISRMAAEAGGDLPAGAYQFAVRLLNRDGNATGFGRFTDPFPLADGDASDAGGRDGSPPGTPTGKSIRLFLEGLDTRYAYYQVCIVSYEGLEGAATARVTERLPLSQSSAQWSYTSPVYQKTTAISLDEALSEPVRYQTARHIQQKDGRLLVSSLRAAQREQGMQAVANAIKVSYFIEERTFTEQISIRRGAALLTDSGLPAEGVYAREERSVEMKGYRRGEVYSLAIVPLFLDGSTGDAYHIPAESAVETAASTTTRRTGTYLSESLYPPGHGFPTGRVRHHRMPTLEQEPHFRLRLTSSQTDTNQAREYAVRILGLELDNIVFPPVLKAQLAGYLIVRQPRTREHASLGQQGVAFKMHRVTFADVREGNQGVLDARLADPFNSVLVHPLFNGSVSFNGDLPWFGVRKDGGGSSSQKAFPHIVSDHVAFHSAETTITGDDPAAGGGSLRAEMVLTGYMHPLWADNQVKGRGNGSGEPFDGAGAAFLFNYTSTRNDPNKTPSRIAGSLLVRPDNLGEDADTHRRKGRTPKNASALGGVYTKYSDQGSPGFRLLRLASRLSDQDDSLSFSANSGGFWSSAAAGRQFFLRMWPDIGLINGGDDSNPRSFAFDGPLAELDNISGTGKAYGRVQDGNYWRSRVENTLYNVVRVLPRQYGDLETAEYSAVGQVVFDTSSSPTRLRVFGGDTFIDKWSFQTRASADQAFDNATRMGPDGLYYTRNLFWLFTESAINTALRHSVEPSEDASGARVPGTPPFWPRFRNLLDQDTNTWSGGVLNLSESLGQGGAGYNRQYSFENRIKLYFAGRLSGDEVVEFDNRTIYSEQLAEGEAFDAFRAFLPNNYHDTPRHKGPITDTFVFNDDFYIHTASTLFRTSFNREAAVATEGGGTLVLGNGGLFPVPGKEVLTVAGGYGGTTSKWASCNTPYGRFFLDNLQGKVFLFNGELVEISDQGMRSFFAEKLRKAPLEAPLTGNGHVSGFDYGTMRWMLTILDNPVLAEGARARYAGEWNNSESFTSSLVAGRSIVLKDGIYQLYKGRSS